MQVSMDGLRKQLLYAYNSLTDKLNEETNSHGEITTNVDYIQHEMEMIRSCIVTLAFTYMDGEDGWKSMDENTHFEKFNPKLEE